VFFSPLDICYALCHFTPLYLTLWVLKELSRAKKVYKGVLMASVVYPESVIAMAVAGTLVGKEGMLEGHVGRRGVMLGGCWMAMYVRRLIRPKHGTR
jgi:hypothetical protein